MVALRAASLICIGSEEEKVLTRGKQDGGGGSPNLGRGVNEGLLKDLLDDGDVATKVLSKDGRKIAKDLQGRLTNVRVCRVAAVKHEGKELSPVT